MYEQSGWFNTDPVVVHGTGGTTEPPIEAVIYGAATETQITFSENVGLSMENLSYPFSCGEDHAITVAVADSVATTTTPMENTAHSQQMDFHMENQNPYNNNDEFNNIGSSHDLSFHQNQQHFPYHTEPTPDLLNLLHLPRTTTQSSSPFGNNNSSVSFENPNLSVAYDPLLHLNLQSPPPQASAVREAFHHHHHHHHPLPHHGYNNTTMLASKNDFVFGEVDGMDQDHGRAFGINGVLEFTQDHVTCAVGTKKRGGKRVKSLTPTTERQRREDLGAKFDALKDLIPNPKRTDRASVVGEAIEYIKELLRTVNELKLLAEKKRHEKFQRIKRLKVEEGGTDLKNLGPIGDNSDEHSYNESLRSSWIQRKSKDTEVDVRIVDDEVTIKLVQRKKINCLVYASQVLSELKLDLQHVAGGYIGDYCSFLLNSKICEGSSVYASAIASKLIEVLDRGFSAA